jgi:hypothetical protein
MQSVSAGMTASLGNPSLMFSAINADTLEQAAQEDDHEVPPEALRDKVCSMNAMRACGPMTGHAT